MTALALPAFVGLVVVGCGGGGDGGGDDGEGDAGSDTTEAGTGSTGVDTAGWEQVTPGGDCQCTDGSEYNLYVHEGDPQKVVLCLQDGGACFSAETCDPDSGLYNTALFEVPPGSAGIFDFSDERNPFADYSVVYAPYCSGDVFLGNATTEYADGLTIQHKGYTNGTAALDELATRFSDATDIVVIGESAGSVAAPLYAGLAADRFPDARITSLSDGSGSYPDAPEITGVVADAWDTGSVIPDWDENAGLTAEQWSSFPGLYIQAGLHDPDIVLARHDYAYDAIWYRSSGSTSTTSCPAWTPTRPRSRRPVCISSATPLRAPSTPR